ALHVRGNQIAVAGAWNQRFWVARYTRAGAPDAGFTAAPATVSSAARAVAIQENGKVLAAGSVVTPTNAWRLARYTDTGAPDPTFNGTGTLTVDFSVSVDP